MGIFIDIGGMICWLFDRIPKKRWVSMIPRAKRALSIRTWFTLLVIMDLELEG